MQSKKIHYVKKTSTLLGFNGLLKLEQLHPCQNGHICEGDKQFLKHLALGLATLWSYFHVYVASHIYRDHLFLQNNCCGYAVAYSIISIQLKESSELSSRNKILTTEIYAEKVNCFYGNVNWAGFANLQPTPFGLPHSPQSSTISPLNRCSQNKEKLFLKSHYFFLFKNQW